MRIGVVILPEARWSDARALWQRAEVLGFDHAWTYDHLAWRTLRDSSWFGSVPVLAAAALSTSRIRVGPLVASINFRHPVTFAKELVALDDLAAGRLWLGIGAGSEGWDAQMLEANPWSRAERAHRFEEFVEVLDGCLREREFTRFGEYYDAIEVRTYPGCVQRPRVPFVVAAAGPRSMAVAAQFGQTWVTTGPSTGSTGLDARTGSAAVAKQIARLTDVCAEVGRDPDSLDRMVVTGPELDAGLTSRTAFEDVVAAYDAVGVTDLVVHWPRDDGPFAGDIRTFESIFTS
jgi:alkanesulfonate monooxygenase SsuD/methylene tetrahydromethanopterin reductase-like flavin-dependent oxidoreductase (luciferase family)